MIDHDRLFKELLREFFVEFVALFLPQLSGYLDTTNLDFLDKEIFTDVTAGDRHVADLVVRTNVRGEDTCFLIHVEHQSSAQSEFNARMFSYFARIYEEFGHRIYPIAIFSYDAPHRAEPDTLEVTFPDLEVLRFRYCVIQLNRLSWRDYVNNPNPMASALMAKMNIAPEDRMRVKFECLRLMLTLELNPAQMQMIAGFVDTYLRLNKTEEQQFNEAWSKLEPEPREAAMRIVTSWEENGIEIGRQREAVAMVTRVLRRRVGELTPELEDRLRVLTVDALEDLTDASFDLTTIHEVENWLEARAPEPVAQAS